ncbi:hypothetical protein BJ912DRAFT_938088 [Pholiota molesta]|nr:hypothetical protein BJ912DRAFT_938088 [Pholiota molesta]
MATTASIPAYLLPGVPVHQPPHLEGDASLATEILPGPPSSVTLQQNALKRDPKKPSMAYSYLPTSDPGSTYSGLTHGTLIGQDLEGPRKRSRVDKGPATGRAQRASARNQGSSSAHAVALDPSTSIDCSSNSVSQPIVIDSDSSAVVLDNEPSLSRSNSSTNLLDPSLPSAPSGRSKRRDKGKEKEKEMESPPLRVKEEPKLFSLNSPEPSNNLIIVPHVVPMALWYIAMVAQERSTFGAWTLPWKALMMTAMLGGSVPPSPRKPPPSLLSAVIHHLQISNPVEFQLPEDIRTYFKDVGTGAKGNYFDSSGIKPPRLKRVCRHGQLEDRDPYRLRDRNGGPVLCFQCGISALPDSLSATAPAAKRIRRSTSKASTPDAWKSIISCDYCSLHWHMDCLDPPLLTLPPFNKKWMCPNHAERVLPHKRRIPKQHATPIEITKPRQFNNGNIEVIHPEYSSTLPTRNMPADEVLINGRRYRVPERVIVLDFWNKLNKWDEHITQDIGLTSGMSSPLTSLSSLDDSDDLPTPLGDVNGDLDDLSAAQASTNFFSYCAPSLLQKELKLRKPLVDGA